MSQPPPAPSPPSGAVPGFPPEDDERAHGRHRSRSRYSDLRRRADRTGKAVQAKAEDLRARRASVRTAYHAYEYDRRHGGALLAGGLAYRFFLWLLPAALFLASLASIFGRVFDNPSAVFTEEILKPETQDLAVFADGVNNIVDYVNGAIVVPPGAALSIQGITVVGTGLCWMAWSEVPLSA